MARDSTFELRPIDALIPYARNSRTHSDEQIALIAGSIDEFGLVGAVVVRDGVIAKGHGTLSAIRKLVAAGKTIHEPPGAKQGGQAYAVGMVPVIDASGWTDSQFRAFVIADNKLAERAGWDTALLGLELGELRDDGFALDGLGFEPGELGGLLDLDTEAGAERGPSPSLADRFMIAPFSVLDSRRGWWTERKRAWSAVGIDSGDGLHVLANCGEFGVHARELRPPRASVQGGSTWHDRAFSRAKNSAGRSSCSRPSESRSSRWST